MLNITDSICFPAYDNIFPAQFLILLVIKLTFSCCCFLLGWSNHFVSKRKYHVVIPNHREWNKPLEDGVLNIHSHLLHGLIHCNGFGHLLCINGIEGGSKYLCGREIMDLWDRICEILRAR